MFVKSHLVILFVMSLMPRSLLAQQDVPQISWAVSYFEQLYEQASSQRLVASRKSVVSALMLATACTHHRYGSETALRVINSSRQKVLTSNEKIHSYLETLADTPRIWQLPSTEELTKRCAEIGL